MLDVVDQGHKVWMKTNAAVFQREQAYGDAAEDVLKKKFQDKKQVEQNKRKKEFMTSRTRSKPG